MTQILPLAPDDYDSVAEQQMRQILEDRIQDIEGKLASLQTTTGALRLVDGDVTLANGANNDIPVGYSTVVRIEGPSGSFSISGFEGGELGRYLVLRNTTAQQMTITNAGAGSVIDNRILTGTGADVVLAGTGGAVAVFYYDAVAARWILMGTQG